jgi:hypothetical protein
MLRTCFEADVPSPLATAVIAETIGQCCNDSREAYEAAIQQTSCPSVGRPSATFQLMGNVLVGTWTLTGGAPGENRR